MHAECSHPGTTQAQGKAGVAPRHHPRRLTKRHCHNHITTPSFPQALAAPLSTPQPPSWSETAWAPTSMQHTQCVPLCTTKFSTSCPASSPLTPPTPTRVLTNSAHSDAYYLPCTLSRRTPCRHKQTLRHTQRYVHPSCRLAAASRVSTHTLAWGGSRAEL